MKTNNHYCMVLFITVVSIFLICSCSTKRKRLTEIPTVKFSNSYEEVWNALEELIINDLSCAPKKLDKKRGIIETEWVYRFDTEGNMRWMIVGQVKNTQGGPVVIIDKIEERPDTSAELKRSYKRNESRPDDPSIRSGWRTQDIPMGEIRGLYESLDRKLSTE